MKMSRTYCWKCIAVLTSVLAMAGAVMA